MIAHVAEASEFSGRVVLWLDPETPCTPLRLDSAVRLAAAYGAEIETLIVEEACEDEAEYVPIRHIRRVGSCKYSNTLSFDRRELLTRRCRRAVETEDAGDAAHGLAPHRDDRYAGFLHALPKAANRLNHSDALSHIRPSPIDDEGHVGK